ncbi:alpha/beta hydrolase family protein [Dactylosporangium matsuzakiense]|uniref:Lipase n=1 Tax=Dactylosporangium matsuzakiense TaxID=53360 RepID=A0A9W6NN73_9ACTN|nr:alpha/beta fold hydrolase [Dactylosporangium matsuzakiense]UWZ44870.1 alpha/beta fold hydrolase [Dactylosporangium matsuzakiense]GLL03655.1 lipase [Dactylosporangium matsuzakiense]
MTSDPRSVLRRPASEPDFTLRYGEHPDHVADVRLPAVPNAPLVLFVHGGFWRREWDRAHAAPLAGDLAARGYAVATIEFRRTGQTGGGWPGTFSDVAAAAVAVPDQLAKEVAHRGLLPVSVDRPIMAGHSAGGHLALWYASVAPDAVGGVVALAPVADLTRAYELDLDGGAVADLLGGGPESVPEAYRSADPMRNLPSGVRTVIVHGADDDIVPVELSRDYCRAARRAGDDATLVELAGVEHFGVIDPLSPAWTAVLAAFGTVTRGETAQGD